MTAAAVGGSYILEVTSDRTLRYLTQLSSLGFDTRLDDDDDIVFTHRGQTWLLLMDDDDPDYFRLVLPNFWPIDDLRERLEALEAANSATRVTKVAKVFVTDRNVWASTELFLVAEDWAPLFLRSLDATWSAVQSFVARMRQARAARSGEE